MSTTNAVAVGNGAYKLATGYAANNFAMAANGATPLTSSSGATLPTTDRLNIGGAPGTVQIDNHLKRLTYWNTRLSNSTLQPLSAV